MTIATETSDPESTRRLGWALAGVVTAGDVILLVGGLGSGKTTFVQGLAAGLGYDGEVTSPTFTLSHVYETRPCLVHADLWRLERLDELKDLSFEEDLDEGAVLVAEWGEAAESLFGGDALVISFEMPDGASDSVRRIDVLPEGDRWRPRAPMIGEAVSRAVGAGGSTP